MAENIVKEIGETYTSVFDHKPNLRKEIALFLREFEEKRQDREIDHLFHILERVTELKDTEIAKTESLADIHLPKLSAELQVSESISDKLVDRVSSADKVYAEKLEKRRKARTQEWDSFVHGMTSKCIRIDSLYKDKEEEVRQLYQKAEEKFFIRPRP